MTWVEWYAIAVTLLCLVFGFGWYSAHGVIKAISKCDASDWPMIRRMLESL